jgi:hypothetical protein
MAYRDERESREARAAAVQAEIEELEARLAELEAARKTIAGVRRAAWRQAVRELVRPWALLVIVLAVGGGVYVGSAVHVKKEVALDLCPPEASSEGSRDDR